MSIFNRSIDDSLVEKLNSEYKRGGWWRAIASDRDLCVAIRNGYVSVYWKGNSLLKLGLSDDVLIGRTHYKFLLRGDAEQRYVEVRDGVVKLDSASELFQTDLSDIAALKRAAAAYVGEEKAGVHQIVRSNSNVFDVEIAFGLEGDSEMAPSAQRIDFAALRPEGDGAVVVFYEAKLFSNGEIRASGDRLPSVVKQIEGYRRLILKHASDVEQSYRRVFGNLVALDGVRERYSATIELMRRVASGEAALHVSEAVRLAVFGFDRGQRDGTAWKAHCKKLEEALGKRLLLKGNPQGFVRGISTA